MPIYEYKCDRCGTIVEAIQKFSDKPLTTCSHCQGGLHKIISHNNFHLKGSGWYVTDYAGKSKDAPEPSKPKEAPKPASSGDGAGN